MLPRNWAHILGRRSRPAWALAWVGLLAAAGCRTPPASPSACGGKCYFSRTAIGTGQVLEDSAVQLAVHPLETTGTVVRQVVCHAGTAVRCVTDRVVLQCQGEPAPLEPCRPTLDP